MHFAGLIWFTAPRFAGQEVTGAWNEHDVAFADLHVKTHPPLRLAAGGQRLCGRERISTYQPVPETPKCHRCP